VQMWDWDATSGLEQVEFPPITSVGGVYTPSLSGDYHEHTYAFIPSCEEEAAYR
jgi:hypothetical protein